MNTINIGLAATLLNHYEHRGKTNWQVVTIQVPDSNFDDRLPDDIHRLIPKYFVVAGADEHGYEDNPHAFTFEEARALAVAYLKGEMS